MKRLIKTAIILILVLTGFAVYKSGVFTNSLSKIDYNSKNIYVYNATDDKEVFKKKADEKVAPASLTKIMTAYVALENISNLNDVAPVDVETYKKLVSENASMAGFYGRERVTYRDLLYGTVLASGGECACSLAVNTSGSMDKFVDKMNEKADELKLKNTHFTNPEGLDEKNQYSSAKDIGNLLKTALQNENFRKIFTTSEYTSTATLDHPSGKKICSTVMSKLYDYNMNGYRILGGKSGTTRDAGLCWATLAEKNGKEYIIVVMGVPFDDISNHGDGQIQDTVKILEQL